MHLQPTSVFSKFAAAKNKHALPFLGLLLLYTMAFALQHRAVRIAIFIGECLRRSFESNYVVNSTLAYAYRQLNHFDKECACLMSIVPSNRGDIDLLFRTSEAAAFAGDAKNLALLRDWTAEENPAMHAHIKGLLAFVEGESDYATHFQQVVRAYLDPQSTETADASPKSVNRLLRSAYATGRPLPEFVRAAANIRELSVIDELLRHEPPAYVSPSMSDAVDTAGAQTRGLVNPVVLISCSTGYLRVFADYYVRTLRRRNDNLVHFHVVADNIADARTLLDALKMKHSGVGYSLEARAGRSQTYITLSRFFLCREIMKHYSSDVLVSDIDVNVYFDLRILSESITNQKCDFGLLVLGYPIPWGTFAVGFSYFRFNNQASEKYLQVLATYLAWLFNNGGFFSMDMVGGMIAHAYLKDRGFDSKLLDLSKYVNVMRLSDLPKTLEKGKIQVKFGRGAPQ